MRFLRFNCCSFLYLVDYIAAKQQIINNNYTAPFQAENKKVVALAIELDEMGKGIIDWSEVE